MNRPPQTYLLPADLHHVLATEYISVSPTGELPGRGLDFYAVIHKSVQEGLVDSFGGTPCEAVAKVLSKLGKPWMIADAGEFHPDASVAAIQFALEDEDGLQFLRLWNEGEFEAIRREWPDAPKSVFIGADTLYKPV